MNLLQKRNCATWITNTGKISHHFSFWYESVIQYYSQNILPTKDTPSFLNFWTYSFFKYLCQLFKNKTNKKHTMGTRMNLWLLSFYLSAFKASPNIIWNCVVYKQEVPDSWNLLYITSGIVNHKVNINIQNYIYTLW